MLTVALTRRKIHRLMPTRTRKKSGERGQSSLWMAQVSQTLALSKAKTVEVTPRRAEEIRQEVAEAAKSDPFTSDVPTEVLHSELA